MKNVKKGKQNKINTSVLILDENRLNSPMKKAEMIKFIYKKKSYISCRI